MWPYLTNVTIVSYFPVLGMRHSVMHVFIAWLVISQWFHLRVSMLADSFSASLQFVLVITAASAASHVIIGGTSVVYVCIIVTAWSLSYNILSGIILFVSLSYLVLWYICPVCQEVLLSACFFLGCVFF